jgi:hypothetical protein
LLTRGDPAIRADDPEPALRDLLDDPVLGLVLKSDRVRRSELLGIIERAQARLGHGFPSSRASGSAVRIDCTV